MAEFCCHSPALISRVFWRNGHYCSFSVSAHLDLVREIEFCFVLPGTNSSLIIDPLTIIIFIHDCWEISWLFITIWESCQRCTIDQKFWLITHRKHLASILPSSWTSILFSSLDRSRRNVLDRHQFVPCQVLSLWIERSAWYTCRQAIRLSDNSNFIFLSILLIFLLLNHLISLFKVI